MLQTIRDHALERLTDAEEADVFRRAHAYHYLELATQAERGLAGKSQAEWLDRLQEDHDNLRAALAWCAGHGPADDGLRLATALYRFWRARGYLAEGRARLGELLAGPDRARSVARARALHVAGLFASQRGDYGEARALIADSLDICREIGDERGIAWTLVDLGIVTRYEGDQPAARALLDEGLALMRQADDRPGMAAALCNLGLVARDQGDPDGAEAYLDQSLAVWQDLGDRVGTGWALTALAMVARARGVYDLARRRTEESLAIWRELGDRLNTANTLAAAARLARDQGQPALARTQLLESLDIFTELDDRRGIAFVLEGFAGLTAAEGTPLRAHCLVAAAEALRRIIGAGPPPAWRADLDESLAAASRELDAGAIEAARAQGRAMTLAEAVALVREASPPASGERP